MWDDIVHLVATGGAGISTVCTLILIWLLHHLLDEVAILRGEIASTREELAELRGEVKAWREK